MTVQVAPRKTTGMLNSSLSVGDDNKMDKLKKVREELDDIYYERDIERKAYKLGFKYINLYGMPVDTSDLALLTEAEAREYNLAVFYTKGKEMRLATPEPTPEQLEIIKKLQKRKYNISMYLCSQRSFDKLIKTYKQVIKVHESEDDISISQDKLDKLREDGLDLNSLADRLKRTSTSDFVNLVLIAAMENKASDIHFEPEKETYELRFRLDGVLYNFGEFNKDVQKRVESRIKILSELKLNVDNIPQDGRFSFSYGGKHIDVRVSMLPSNYGYSIVMRLLGTGNVNLTLDSLGFYGENKKKVQKALEKNQGMILTTGPTGSGKTTTLYTFLSDLNDGSNKIITLEDPVEYRLEGVSQTQIDEEAGYTFASGLRSILRQDPDVVMVGEVRDQETADVAVQAALTGHKVLSTLHTNDAVGAVSRLMEMGVDGYLIADSLQIVIGQRLIRRTCEYCQEIDNLTKEQRLFVNKQINALPEERQAKLPEKLEFYTSKGCQKCNNLGYKGRLGVYEILTMTDGVRDLLSLERPSFTEVRRVAQQEGMVTMVQDGILKALAGFTDIEEILRAVD